MEDHLQETKSLACICLGVCAVHVPCVIIVSLISLTVCREKSQGRLGTLKLPETHVYNGVPYPMRLDIPGVRVVSLAAGGMYVVSSMVHLRRERLAVSHNVVGSNCTTLLRY